MHRSQCNPLRHIILGWFSISKDFELAYSYPLAYFSLPVCRGQTLTNVFILNVCGSRNVDYNPH